MLRLELGCIALLSLTLATACADDSRGKEVVAPDVLAADGTVLSGHSDHDSDGDGDSDIRFVEMEDACDPKDTGWSMVPGGCLRKRGTVSLAEFNDEADSPLSAAVVGHPSWRNDPSYGVIKEGQKIRVRNTGGRPHTFTKVAEFGAGIAPNPALNKGLLPTPECAQAVTVPPGGHAKIEGLAAGGHRFMCCFHPWMRAVVEVKAK